MEREQLQALYPQRQRLRVETHHELAEHQEYDEPVQGLGHGTEAVAGVADWNNGSALRVGIYVAMVLEGETACARYLFLFM